MPSKSKKQHNFMEAVAHNPAFAKKTRVPQSVGKEFSKADKGKTFKRGGDMATKKMATKKMAMGGMSAPMPAGAPMDPRKAAMMAQMMKARRAGARPGMPAPTAPMAPAAPGMKKGGAVFTKSADGIAKRGKTQGTQIKMAKGGSAKKYC